jgi:hypothetical protein
MKLQPTFRRLMFEHRAKIAPTFAGTPTDDPARRFTLSEAYVFVYQALALIGPHTYKQPKCQCREEVQRWSRNGLVVGGKSGAGTYYWTDLAPPDEFKPVARRPAAWVLKPKPWAAGRLTT